GEFDLAGVEHFESVLAKVEAESPQVVVIDLTDLEFMDSSGLRALVMADRRARKAGRRLALVPGPRPVRRVCELSQVDSGWARAEPFLRELEARQPALGELPGLKLAREAVERMASFPGGLRAGPPPHVQAAHGFVTAQVERHPSGRPVLFPAALEAWDSFVSG